MRLFQRRGVKKLKLLDINSDKEIPELKDGTALDITLLPAEKGRWNCIENYRSMLQLCNRYKVPVIINSDAHDPSSVGNFTLAVKLIEDLDINKNLILNFEYDKLMDFLCN